MRAKLKTFLEKAKTLTKHISLKAPGSPALRKEPVQGLLTVRGPRTLRRLALASCPLFALELRRPHLKVAAVHRLCSSLFASSLALSTHA